MTSFTEQAGGSFPNDFLGPKSFRHFRDKGPRLQNQSFEKH